MTVSARKITAFAKTIAALADLPNLGSTALLKQWFDSSPEELRVSINGLIDDLIATAAGASGTEQIGSAPIAGVAGATAYAQLVDLKNQLNGVVLGQLPPDMLTSGLNRQAIINGNFDIWQRGTSFTINNATPYTADRWKAYRATLALGMTVSRQDGSGVNGSKYCLRAQRDSGNAATNQLVVLHVLESVDSQKFRGNKETVSFYARVGANYSAASSLLNVALNTGTGTDESGVGTITGFATAINTDVTLTASWQKFSFSSANLASTVNQIFLAFTSTPTGTAGANDYFEITQIQINSGNSALAFQPKSFSDELALCQRYYEKSYSYTVAPATATSAFGLEDKIVPSNTIVANQTYGKVSFKVKKRISPTVTIYPYTTPSNTGMVSNSSGTDLGASSGGVVQGGDDGFSVVNNSGGVLTTTINAVTFHWASDAEL